MSRKAIPESLWSKIRSDWSAGIPVTTLADIYGLGVQTIYNKKSTEKWDAPVEKVAISIKKAQDASEGRVLQFLEKTEQSMKNILTRHKRVSERIADLLEDAVGKIENSDEGPQKMLHALKTASDVAATLQKNERRSWGMDEKQGVSSLEDFLDNQEGKLTVLKGAK